MKLDQKYPLDIGRFSPEAISRFIKGETVKTAELINELREYFEKYLIFPKDFPGTPLLLACWVMATYLYRVFNVFPFISLRSATKECGKSRTEDLFSYVCFNAGSRESSPSEASLFRGPSKNGGTRLYDEIEFTVSKERFGELVSILNSGFERGGVVIRLEKRGDKFEEQAYPTYCPRVLAGISKLANTLEGRSITIFMPRKLASEKLPRINRAKMMDRMQPTRDKAYIWALCNASGINKVYDEIEDFDNESLKDLSDALPISLGAPVVYPDGRRRVRIDGPIV